MEFVEVPPLRFPEFTDEWKTYKVSDVLDFYSTNSLSWDQLEYSDGELRNLHYGLIHVGLPTLVNLKDDLLPTIKEGNTPKNYTLCLNGDVAFADASEDTNDVAKARGNCLPRGGSNARPRSRPKAQDPRSPFP